MIKIRQLVIFLSLVSVSLVVEAQDKYTLTVSQDGKGDFTTIQQAVDASKAFPDQRVTIFVKNGTHREKVRIPSCNSLLSIIGESTDKTILSFNDYFSRIGRGRNSTFYTGTLTVEANDFVMENITVENYAGPVGQAVALHVEGDRCLFVNCRFLGSQDTLYAAGRFSRQYFLRCFVEGTTDFIFGEATALFQQCEIHCKADSYITAASTPEGKPFGFVFNNCKITAAANVSKVFLGRPWRSFAKVTYLNCELGSFILPAGWDNWSKSDNERTAQFAEFGNRGAGAIVTGRVAWSKKLTEEQSKAYSKEQIFVPLGWELPQKICWYNADKQ